MADIVQKPRGTMRERCEARIASMKVVRKPFETDWQEIARLALPSKPMYLTANTGRNQRRANQSKQDTAGRIAGRTLVNGMATGLSSAARKWLKVTTPDSDLAEYGPVKDHLYQVESEIYRLFAHTNYYEANKVCYAQLGHMGAACKFGFEHSDYGMVWPALEVGEYWLEIDNGLRVSGVAWRKLLTVANVVQSYPWEKLTRTVREAYNRGDTSMMVPIMVLVEFNRDRDQDYWDYGNKPWRSIHWEEGNSSKKDDDLLRVSGFDSKPFTAPRWETTGAQVYSDTAPAFDALPDLRELELMGRRYGRAMDLLVKPPMGIPAGLQQTPISLDPGSLNFFNDMQSKPGPLWNPDPNVLIGIENGRDKLTMRVNQIMYADLWMAITDMEGIQPRNEQELFYRNEEKLTQLGPVVDRVNLEMLEGDIDRAYDYLLKTRRIPPPPPELREAGLQIDFVSILAQAQKAAENTSIERIARFVGFLSGTFPDAALKFDAQEAVDEYAANIGGNPKIIRSDEIVAKLIEQQQQQQQAQQALAAAPAVRDVAQGAELLSRTQAGPTDRSVLDQIMNPV